MNTVPCAPISITITPTAGLTQEVAVATSGYDHCWVSVYKDPVLEVNAVYNAPVMPGFGGAFSWTAPKSGTYDVYASCYPLANEGAAQSTDAAKQFVVTSDTPPPPPTSGPGKSCSVPGAEHGKKLGWGKPQNPHSVCPVVE